MVQRRKKGLVVVALLGVRDANNETVVVVGLSDE